jgi:hypothetical protein
LEDEIIPSHPNAPTEYDDYVHEKKAPAADL